MPICEGFTDKCPYFMWQLDNMFKCLSKMMSLIDSLSVKALVCSLILSVLSNIVKHRLHVWCQAALQMFHHYYKLTLCCKTVIINR